MDGFVLTDAQWPKMEPHCLGKPGDPGGSGKDNWLFVAAVLWIARTGSPWRDLSAMFRPLEEHIHALSRRGEGGCLKTVVRVSIGVQI